MSQSFSARQLEMDKQRKVFHSLPAFLKVGVYYKTKHEMIRQQTCFKSRFLAFELIRNEGNFQVAMGRYDRACRNFEEALSVWRYYTTSDNDWQINGVSDENLQEVDIIGNTPEEKETVF